MKIKHHLIILLITFCYTELFVAQNGIVRPVHGANYDNTCKGITAKYVNANITEDGNYTNNCSANYYVDIVTTEDIARGYQVKFLENQRANWNLNWMDLRLGDKLIWLGGSPNWVKKNGYWFAENAILADCGNGCTVRKIDSEFQKKSNTTDFKLENFEDDVGMSSGSNLEQNRQRWENNLNKATTGRVVSYVDTDGTKKTIPVDTKVEHQLTQCQAYWAELYPVAYEAWSNPRSATYDSRRAFNRQTIPYGPDRRKMRRCFEGPSVGRVVVVVGGLGVAAVGTYVAVDALTHDNNGDGGGGTVGPIPGDKD